jgi:hypothetical protein
MMNLSTAEINSGKQLLLIETETDTGTGVSGTFQQ